MYGVTRPRAERVGAATHGVHIRHHRLQPLPREHGVDGWQRFATGGPCELALHAIPAQYRDGIEIAEPAEARHGRPIKFVLRVEDATKARDELAAKGARFVDAGPAADGPLVRFDLLDPEGNVVQLSQE